MGNIIDLIFDNLFFIVLIGGAILNFLSRNKEETKPQEKKRNAPKPVKEIDWKEIFRQEAQPIEPEKPAHTPIESKPAMNYEMQDTMNEGQKQLVQKRKELQKYQETIVQQNIKDSPIFNSEIKEKSTAKNSYFHNLTKDEVVRGVVWSEVLGPPRSKKPLEKIYRK